MTFSHHSILIPSPSAPYLHTSAHPLKLKSLPNPLPKVIKHHRTRRDHHRTEPKHTDAPAESQLIEQHRCEEGDNPADKAAEDGAAGDGGGSVLAEGVYVVVLHLRSVSGRKQ